MQHIRGGVLDAGLGVGDGLGIVLFIIVCVRLKNYNFMIVYIVITNLLVIYGLAQCYIARVS